MLKHLNGKWGSSNIAVGEPVLFPYNPQDSMSFNRRWTLNDGDISAGAVYAAIGSPAVFRLRYQAYSFLLLKGIVQFNLSDLICFLRYGWFSTECKTTTEPSTSANDKADLLSEGVQRYSSATTEGDVGKHTVLARKDFRSVNSSETTNADTWRISTGAVDLKVKFSAASFSVCSVLFHMCVSTANAHYNG